MTSKDIDKLKALEDLEMWMNAIYAPRHQHQNLEALKQAGGA